MKLRATITRYTSPMGGKSIRFVFPKEVKPYMRESIIERNLGPRPWGEGTYVESNGNHVRLYWKGTGL